MSIAILAALAMASIDAPTKHSIDRNDWPQIATAARRANMPTETLYRALTAPSARTPSRYQRSAQLCIRHDEIVPTKTGMVCRTRNEWAELGVEILSSRR